MTMKLTPNGKDFQFYKGEPLNLRRSARVFDGAEPRPDWQARAEAAEAAIARVLEHVAIQRAAYRDGGTWDAAYIAALEDVAELLEHRKSIL
jgi:hypothetical protein